MHGGQSSLERDGRQAGEGDRPRPSKESRCYISSAHICSIIVYTVVRDLVGKITQVDSLFNG